MKKRYYYIDFIKAIAIIMVCSYHFQMLNNLSDIKQLNLEGYISRFFFNANASCVSLFFMASGAMLLNKQFDISKHKKRICRIIYQFFIWYIITTVITLLFGKLNMSDYNTVDYINHVFINELSGIPFGHYWFIFALVGTYILLPFFSNVYAEDDNKINVSMIIFIGFLFFLYFFMDGIGTIFKVFNIDIKIDNIASFQPFKNMNAIMILFFILGGYLHKEYRRLVNIPLLYVIFAYSIGLTLLFIKFYIISSKIGSYDPVWYGYGTISNLIMSSSLFIMVMKLDSVCDRYVLKDKHFFINIPISVVQTIGKNTLVIFYMHEIIGNIVMPYVYMKIPQCGILINLTKALIIVGVCTILGETIKKIPVLKRILI